MGILEVILSIFKTMLCVPGRSFQGFQDRVGRCVPTSTELKKTAKQGKRSVDSHLKLENIS